MTKVPPIKSQGIKTKLVDWIRSSTEYLEYDRWVEPFMGTGVVAFNICPKSALLCDSNPHLIEFYRSVQAKDITGEKARSFLMVEGQKLLNSEGEHYYVVRDRFNKNHNPLDFLFLNRSCFNGMMRFNKGGGFNVPFCRKPKRFARALITKICNQIETVSSVMDKCDFTFVHQDFRNTLGEVGNTDLIYCDPPYIGRHVDYFNSWSKTDDYDLHSYLANSHAKYILSTWLMNSYRVNHHVFTTWQDCSIITKSHFYFIGAKETNRNAMTEALLVNYSLPDSIPVKGLKVSELGIERKKLSNWLSSAKIANPFSTIDLDSV